MLRNPLRPGAPDVFRSLRGVSLLTWALVVPVAGHAGEHASPATPHVVDAFRDYQRWQETPLADWREANERVREIGGWRTYLRESQQAAEPAGAHHGH